MPDRQYTIKNMSREEFDIAVEWAAQEGWNPGLTDADSFYAADPNGFLIGYLGDEPIASISVVQYGDSFGFLGFYIVKPEHRGKGYGLQIWNAGMKYLGARNIGLDGVVAQQENYKQSGFKLAYRNIRFEGRGGSDVAPQHEIVDLSAIDFKAVELYDRSFFPADRSAFLQSWLAMPNSKRLGVMKNGVLAGYGVIRSCKLGYKIGPLFADTPQIAEDLFSALKSNASASEPVYLDVPEVNQAAVDMAERHGMKVVFETARMYTQEAPRFPLERLFGVTTFELG